MPDAQGQPGGCTSCSLLRMTVEGGGDLRNWPFYGFWQGPIGQSALCFSLGGPYFLSRAAFASCFCRKASYSGVPVGPGLPWPVVWGADVVVFAVSVMVLLSPSRMTPNTIRMTTITEMKALPLQAPARAGPV